MKFKFKMEFKKKIVLTFAIIGAGVLTSHAQTGIGTINPDNSAQLDISSTTRGLLLPRIELVRTTDEGPVKGPAKSLMVYNTVTINDVTPGFYYWEGTKWVKMATGSDSGTGQSLGLTIIENDYTVLPTDYAVVASKLRGDITVTLPDVLVNKGRVLVINQTNGTNTGGDDVTVKFNVPVVYSDAVSKNELIAPFYSATGGSLKITLQSDGTNWHVISSL
ncbi:hypothetical protein [Flavobacterium aquidurense]|uniref:Hep Hag family protein n=1 Tax=Flavobacterium aquidurense TaxID=362413 RepID=A0A0N8VMS3_9FLAO|nr:hypothetical protein [Flavobacterium aquidurense]KQB40124.1 Hep Hag family protein [Flavobacterium aquidurense]